MGFVQRAMKPRCVVNHWGACEVFVPMLEPPLTCPSMKTDYSAIPLNLRCKN